MIDRFFFAPASPLAALRVGLAAVLLLQALACQGSLLDLHGGLVQAPIIDSYASPYAPRVWWLPAPLGEDATVRFVFALHLGALAALLVGWHARFAAALAAVLHLTLATSAGFSAYGAYSLGHIGLVYLAAFPCSGKEPSWDARLGLRTLQLHLCIVYLSSGIEKAIGWQWWTGDALWRALAREDLPLFDFSWLASYPLLCQLACWATLLVEIGYAFLVWPRATRRFAIGAAILLHLGIAATMGLWAFSGIMIVLNVAAFLVPSDGKTP